MGEGGTKPSSGHDDTIPASTPPERSSLPNVPPPPDARYRLGQELGRGGMGRVVEAFDTHLGRTVALKEVLPQGGNIDRRFQREVRITARLEHASIVPLYDSGRLADGRPFYVMRRVSGKPLDEAIANAGGLDRRLALLPNVLAAIDAVAHAHSRGVIHRDLKPQNILVGSLGETVVIDWGLAKVIGDDDDPPDSLEPHLPSAADSVQTQVGSIFGTPGFMAPEQARGDELGPAGDVYALGATLYQMLVGKPPFGGTSATEMISKTLRNRLEPIATAAPDAPAELRTIIEKALAYEQRDRYPNAGELAEDVRRFLTGQLVGAHHYTPRQRLTRFARRHRAALIVAALASVGIAVLAWIGVHRIVRERDTAERASLEAREQREKADARAAELRVRADLLLLGHARGLVNDNPTQALAVLKQVADTRGNGEAIKAIARSAIVRGVAWGAPSLPDVTTVFEMSPDGRRVVQLDKQGGFQVVDLDTHRVIATRKMPIGTRAHWVDQGRRLALMMPKTALTLYDPVSGTDEPLNVPPIDDLAMADDTEHLALLTASGEVLFYDLAKRRATPVPDITGGRQIVMTHDGKFVGVTRKAANAESFVIVDGAGRVVASHTGTVMVPAAGATRMAVAFWQEAVYEIDLAEPHPVFRATSIEAHESKVVYGVTYLENNLYLLTPSSLWRVSTAQQAERIQEFPSGALYFAGIADNVLVSSGTDGLVTVWRGEMQQQLRAPTYVTGMLRVASRPTASRIVVAGREALFVWDTKTFMPRDVPSLPEALFVDEKTLVSPAPTMNDWTWLDVTTGQQRRKEFHGEPGMLGKRDVEGGRVLVLNMDSEKTSNATIVDLDGREMFISKISWRLACLVPGNAVVFSPGKGRVFGIVGKEQPRELVTLDSPLLSIDPLGTLGYVALSERGELVRGSFDGHDFQRTVVPDVDEHAFAAAESAGTVLIASRNSLRRWDGATISEVAQLRGDIDRLYTSPTGTLVVLADESAVYLRAGTNTPEPFNLPHATSIASQGTRAAGLIAANQVEIWELPSGISWTLPRSLTSFAGPSLSPSGRWLYQTLARGSLLWQVPEPGSDIGEWLDGLTNATEVGDRLHWPWTRDP
jgi:hypothetical protein